MATAFNEFDQYGLGHYPGHLEDRGMADVVSRLAQGSDIGYGLGVVDVDNRTAKLPTGTEASNAITIRDSVRDNPAGNNPEAVYPVDHEMSVIRVGRVWVKTSAGSASGEDVFVIPGTGEITNTSNTGVNIQIVGATFKTAVVAGGIALVQLNGN